MEDRFKFRVWVKTANSYISAKDDADFVYLEEEGDITVGLYNSDLEDMMYLKEEDLIIEQCTGLKDKNGKLIYEGDILKDKYGALHPISWNVKGFYEADTFAVAGFYNAIQEDMEVIGNIHENPELLERSNL